MSQAEPRYADDELLSEGEDTRPARGDVRPGLRGWGTPWAVLLVFLLIGVVLGVYAAGLGGSGDPGGPVAQQGAAPTAPANGSTWSTRPSTTCLSGLVRDKPAHSPSSKSLRKPASWASSMSKAWYCQSSRPVAR